MIAGRKEKLEKRLSDLICFGFDYARKVDEFECSITTVSSFACPIQFF